MLKIKWSFFEIVELAEDKWGIFCCGSVGG